MSSSPTSLPQGEEGLKESVSFPEKTTWQITTIVIPANSFEAEPMQYYQAVLNDGWEPYAVSKETGPSSGDPYERHWFKRIKETP